MATKMKDLSVIIPTVNLSNLNRSPSTSSPCSPTTVARQPQFENDGCMLCVNGTPCCLQKRRATWTLKLRVALYCLSVLHPDKKYFNLKKDIYTYVDNHWELLSINTAKSDRWRKQVQDSLSHCRHFESGWDAMGCNGHWRLIQPLNPWSFPPERENIMLEDDEGVYTPDSSLSPRPSKSPREDPLYRNFPKRRSLIEEEMENRKRKVADAEIQTASIGYEEEGLLMLKYSPMIYAETPSPKCRTPRSNTSSTTSPSIIGNSPMLASSNGAYFTLSNFSNNLSLNTSSSNNPIYHPTPSHSSLSVSTSNITVLDSPSSPRGSSPLSSPNMPQSERLVPTSSGASLQTSSATQHISPPIPSLPFAWKSNSPSNFSKQQAMSDNVRESSKANTLPNPFSGPPSPKYSTPSPNFFSVGSNSTLKVPTELLQKSAPSVILTTNSSSAGSSSSPSSSPSNTSSNISKLQQQNLILNCTY